MSIIKKYRIIVAGGRDFNDYNLLCRTIVDYFSENISRDTDHLRHNVEFISGTAKGADNLGETFAHKYGFEVVRFPADWDVYGKSAGPRRNAEMAKYAAEENGVLIAFWDGKSRGTRSMIDLANRYGLEVHIVGY